MAGVLCPECNAEVQADWDWCHACGFDPEGVRAAAPDGVAVAAPSRLPAVPGAAAISQGVPAVPAAPDARVLGGASYAGGPPRPGAGPGGGPAWSPPGGHRKTGGPGPLAIIIVVVALVLLVPVLAIVAITFLGRSATSRFSSVGTAIDDSGTGGGFVGGKPATPVDWQRTLSSGYSFELPGEPTKETITNHTGAETPAEGAGYRLELPQQTYTIGAYPLATGFTRGPDPGPLLEDELKGLVTANGATIGTISAAPIVGFPARDATVTMGTSTGHCFTIYALEQVIEGCAIGDPMSGNDYHRFFSSIQIG